ncbi:MAG: DNA primase DnaG [Haloarculaceae archaeon]
MYDSAKYLIRADISANGVVERSDVVGAIFGQTEGLLGDELDLRDLQESGKLGRIDVEIESEGGQSFGEVTIASGLDRVETAILAAALESIDRVGPCRADIQVSDLEDVRTAKRREVVDRAKELLADFDESALTSRDLVEEVKQDLRVEDITEFHGFPAGPRVAESDAVIVVEGRSDVLTLLRYGVKNAIAVEGTDVPDAVADLTEERTVTAFLDGDRGGDLILKELAQVGNIDYVALAPPGRSVEDLSRGEVLSALREKVPFEAASGDTDPDTFAAVGEGGEPDGAPPDGTGEAAGRKQPRSRDGPASGGGSPAAPSTDQTADAGRSAPDSAPPSETDGAGTGAKSDADSGGAGASVASPAEPSASAGEQTPGDESNGRERGGDGAAAAVSTGDAETSGAGADADRVDGPSTADETASGGEADGSGETATDGEPDGDEPADPETGSREEPPADDAGDETGGDRADAEDAVPDTLVGHVSEVIREGSGLVRTLDGEFAVLDERPVDEAFDLLESTEDPPVTVVLDGELTQRLLDVAAQRGVGQVVCATEGEYVKQPRSVRIRTEAALSN